MRDCANPKHLLESGQDDFIVERFVLKYMQRATHVWEVRIVNGLRLGQVSAALAGKWSAV
ncbi:hypothetical protein [Nitrospira sp. Nam80]